MKKVIIRIIPTINIILWTLLSFINYLGIMHQLKEDIVKTFIWSIITAVMYMIVIYSVTLYLKRRLLLYQYRDYNLKYINNSIIMKQTLMLFGTILYLYGLCYYSFIFIGLMPIFIFFSGILMNMGRFYVYIKGQLHMVEDITKEYIVIDFDPKEKKLFLQDISFKDHKSLVSLESTYNMDEEEIQFLNRFFVNDSYKVDDEVEAEPMQNIS